MAGVTVPSCLTTKGHLHTHFHFDSCYYKKKTEKPLFMGIYLMLIWIIEKIHLKYPTETQKEALLARRLSSVVYSVGTRAESGLRPSGEGWEWQSTVLSEVLILDAPASVKPGETLALACSVL